MKSVESIVEEHKAQEKRYRLLQASAVILNGWSQQSDFLSNWLKQGFTEQEAKEAVIRKAVNAAEALLAEIERRDLERLAKDSA